ncbi:LysR family transcriptional regulator [Marinobacter lipolyticus SM19]|uniref:LysR family transcriptional regulator n=1 Tax=Marinobacter lipolyticus SM19 TaxID=1318628 RepID=R8AYF7_9GAMM|nr:LysR family transcriptional regulator [Marinobacter lipolyticus]EON91381.1 LysR family transcriptional regulator [Marinobacter lipolyticus SM19]
MDKLLEMQTFVSVVDAKSFVGAAEGMGVSKAAVSRYVNDLETRLGVRLLHRTTRRLSLTDEGEVFYFRCKELLSDVEEAEAELDSRSGNARGLLRINVPVSFGIGHLGPLWGEFHQRHPDVQLDINLADRIVDIVEEGFDLAIRIASLPSSTLISRNLASTRILLCASPDYLATHGTPWHPSELSEHRIIAYSNLATRHDWQFEGPHGAVSVRIRPWLNTNNGDTCRAVALSHQGIILQPDFLVGADLATGSLVEVMPEYRSMELGIYAIYPTRKFVAPKVRALVDFLSDKFSGGLQKAQPDHRTRP